MKCSGILGLVGLAGMVGLSPAGAGGLDSAAPIGPYLDGVLPARAPTAASGSWELVNAFPNLVVVDPVQMIPVPHSNRLLVAEKWGALLVFPNDPAASERILILDLSSQVEASGDSGLLGIAFHPQFGEEGSPNRDHLYVYYRHTPDRNEKDRAYCRLSRFTWQAETDSIDPATEVVLINQYDRHNWHAGGGLFFSDDGFLYLSIGDEGGSNDFFGTTQRRNGGLFSGILRIDVDQDPSRSHPIRRQPVDAEPPPPGWPASATQGYFIPNDNPWQSPDGSQLEEYWAIGARSPYRMSLDRPTGQIWLGDVGQSLREEINLVERGSNLQWPYREGNKDGAVVRPEVLEGVEQAPLFSYGRGEGGCIIGGHVYRGSEHPSLFGKYLFGDFNNGLVRTLDHTPGREPVVEDIAKLGDRQLTSFGLDAQGEIYLLTIGQTFLNGGIIYKLQRNGEARPQPPATLSATGAFSDLAGLTPRAGLMPYDLIQPLWSDGADKKRWIAIPNDGTPDSAEERIAFSENGPWGFPVGTVLIKHFEYEGRRLETRFFVNGEDGKFYGFTYRWRADHSDADLLPGPSVEETIPLAGGRTLRWHFPGRVECFACHSDAAGVVLGPKTRQLNRDLLYPSTGRIANQLATWNELGFFANAPDPAAIPGFLKSANVNDTAESLDRRARSYLDANCSQCHLPGGPTQAGFDARLTTPPHYQNLVNVDPVNGLEFPDPKIVKPGVPDDSVLLFRMGTLDDCCAMPPIAKNALDVDAIRVVTGWIRSLDPVTSPAGPTGEPVPDDLSVPELGLSLPGGPTVAGPFSIEVTASEPVSGLSATDFAVTNGSVLALSGSGATYTLTIHPRLPGTGTVTLPSDRVVDANGNANRRSAVLTFSYQPGPTSPNLLDNGGFESGLGGWKRGGDTTASPLAAAGSGGARLSGSSYLLQSFPVNGGTNHTFAVWCRTGGSGAVPKAVVAFRDAAGRWIADRSLILTSTESFDSFLLDLTSPPNAATATVSFLGAEGGFATIDEATFAEGGPGDPPVGPLTENGDFERELLFWSVENDVTVSTAAHLGQGAARIGPDSSATFARPVLPRTRLVMTGAYFTEGDPSAAVAGLSFWSPKGELVRETTKLLPPSPGYLDFFFFADVPEGVDRLTMWVRNGTGGAVTIDDLGLVHVAPDPPLEPEGPDTGFESGDLGPWTPGGEVDLSANPRTGSKAARLGSVSFLGISRSASPASAFTFRGYYRTAGAWAVREAGLTFRDRDGGTISTSSAALLPTSAYKAFILSATAPANAVSVSAWVFNGSGGTLDLDDLSLRRTGSGDAAGANASAHVLTAGLETRSSLGQRDPRYHSDPRNNLVQPDLAIRTVTGRTVGDNLYNVTGVGQTVVTLTQGRRTVRVIHPVSWQNDASARPDSARLSGTRGNLSFTAGYLETYPAPGNRTAEIVTGRYRTSEVLPRGSSRFQVHLRKSNSARTPRFDSWIQARSFHSPGRRDLVRMLVR